MGGVGLIVCMTVVCVCETDQQQVGDGHDSYCWLEQKTIRESSWEEANTKALHDLLVRRREGEWKISELSHGPSLTDHCDDAHIGEQSAIGLWGEVKALHVDHGKHWVEDSGRNAHHCFDYHYKEHRRDAQKRENGMKIEDTARLWTRWWKSIIFLLRLITPLTNHKFCSP